MAKRFLAIWFRHLKTDHLTRRQPVLRAQPFVLAAPEHGRMVVKAVNQLAEAKGIYTGMVVADCRAVLPQLQVLDDDPQQADKLLNALAEWCLRYTPVVSIDRPEGLILDISGCAHLWGGESIYLNDIITRLNAYGYNVRVAIADTIGAAWAISRYGKPSAIIATGGQMQAILPLIPAALRLEKPILERLEKLGLYTIESFIKMPRSALRRRFGTTLLTRLDQALGQDMEIIESIKPIQPFQERLPSFEPIRTATGIEIALNKLLESLCKRLVNEEKGLRNCTLKGFRIDNNIQQIKIATTRPSRNIKHLFKLFEIKIPTIEPALGFELFLLEATVVEELTAAQEALWNTASNHDEMAVAELLDKLAGKVGMNTIHRYLPDEHYWPERSIKLAAILSEQATTKWRIDIPRPVHLLPKPEVIEVMVPIPDYPPVLFHYKGQPHNVIKADGPERIEQEWWLEQGLYRDYYCVEDEEGARYWLFRSGSYDMGDPKWFIHGFFA